MHTFLLPDSFLTESMSVYGDWRSLRAEYSGRLRRTV